MTNFLSNFFSLNTNTRSIDTIELEQYLETVQLRADKIVDKFIIGFFALGLCLATVYDTYQFSIVTGAVSILLYLLARFAIQNKFVARMLISVVFAIFVLQFIGQMHGMAEIHFVFFTNIAILMIYQDWRIMVPYAILTVTHHSLLAFFQWYLHNPELGQYFITYTQISSLQLGFHFGLVALMALVCAIATYFFRENSIVAFKAQQEVQAKNQALNESIEELRVTQDALQSTLTEVNSQIKAVNAAVGFVEISADRKIIKANKNFCKVIGYSPSEIIGISYEQFMKPSFVQSQYYEDFWQRLLSGNIEAKEYERVTKNGEIVWLYAAYSPVVINGKVIKIIKMAVDVTQRRKAEAEIQKLSLVAAKTSNSVVLTNINKEITWVNDGFTKITGYTAEEAVGKKPSVLLQGKGTNPDHIAAIREGLKHKGSFSQEILNYNKKGEPYWVELSITPILDKQGEVLQYFSIQSDITQRKHDEAEIQRKNEELVASEEELKQSIEELQTTQDKLQTQFDVLELKNKNIADSINYASRIQQALLPKATEIEVVFPENFILFKPRDIVSGDFYWFAHKEELQLQILVVADCTGHGVPGAFMSMLGSSMLNQIIHDREIHEPNHILDLLNEGIEYLLNQKDQDMEVRDGMDAALIAIDKQNNMITFAGANNPLYVISQQPLSFVQPVPETVLKITQKDSHILSELKGDKKPIGGRINTVNYQNYQAHQFKIEEALRLYLFSDGFVDQIGGRDRRKLMSKGFKEVILTLQSQPLHTHGIELNMFFEKWIQNSQKQLDDVLVIGVSVQP